MIQIEIEEILHETKTAGY